MASQVKAGIEFKGNSLRYAEVEAMNGRYRLLRLGSCDFDFDAERQLFGPEDPEWLSTIADALRDVFRGAAAESMSVVIHPPSCVALSVPVPSDVSQEARLERIGWEASLYSEEERMHVVSVTDREPVLSGGDETWLDAIVLPPNIHARIEQVVAVVPPSTIEYISSDRSAANTLPASRSYEEALGDGDGHRILGVGCYEHHVEFFLTRVGVWHASTFAPTGTPADYPYFAASFLEAVGISRHEIAHLACYGDTVDLDGLAPLAGIVECEPERLNPLKIIELETDALRVNFRPEIFAPCIGACI